MLTINQIRTKFLDFFKKNDHMIVPSSPLVPHNDPSLMFTNSGMVQFKNVFTGAETRNYSKAATSQKSVRAGGKHNDLENVGYTARHHTFFEMLGNFSFGDYFKDQAIEYAWEFLTKELGLDKNKLYVTIYHDDAQAEELWKKIAGLQNDRIIKIATNDNFWSMGETGPCGPCSEIFYDHGDKIWGGLPGTSEQDGDRFIEIWNLVFMQYEQHLDGKRTNLPKPCIDTGMGIERIATVLQQIHNNYETDLFRNLIQSAENIVKVKSNGDALFSYRILADHLRSCSFLIADGVMPSNEGRGYVLRRIMRRAMRHVHQLGYKDPLMHQLFPFLVEEMGQAYPELIRAQALISDVLLQEELRFKNTLDKGLRLLAEEEKKIPANGFLNGDIAFKLYDTYGFPLDLTQDILKSKNIKVDTNQFDACMQEQKNRARAAWAGSGESATAEIWFEIYQKSGATDFLGYQNEQVEAVVTDIVPEKDGKFYIITNQTVFYAESGGQMGDRGEIYKKNGEIIKVIDTKKFLGKLHAHLVESNSLAVGDEIELKIDQDYRKNIRIHHSATHLLHYALRKILGEQVIQKGSLVASDRLRFDFSYNKSLSKNEIQKVEALVNHMIWNNQDAHTKLMSTDQAIESGAMALFGEKYDDEVRVVSMGSSIELCGGTHVNRTGDIGMIKIISESAISAGVRRIEALCGRFAIEYLNSQEDRLLELADILKTPKANLVEKVDNLLKSNKLLQDEISRARLKLMINDTEIKTHLIAGIKIIEKFVEDMDIQDVRSFVEHLKANNPNAIIVVGTKNNEKTSLLIGVGKTISEQFDAAKLVKSANEIALGQGGGGKPDLAQAGGFDFTKQKEIINYISSIVVERKI